MVESHGDMVAELLLPEIQQMIEQSRIDEIVEAFGELLDPEVADVMIGLPEELRAKAFEMLPADRAADIFDFLNQDHQESLVEQLSDEQVASVFNQMDPDDRVDFFEDAPEEVAQSTLALMDPDERAQTEQLLEYPEDSVGREMTPDFLTLDPDMNAAQALEKIRREGHDAETLHTLYIVDRLGHLLSHVRLRSIVLADPQQRMDVLHEGTTVSLNTHDDRERAVEVMERYDMPVLPVVDEQGALVGVVTFDDVADVAEEEATEDIHKLGGMAALDQSYLSTGIVSLVRKRGVWLMLLFFGELLAVTAMGFFHKHLQEKVILALFIPLIIASGGNSGSQAATLIIRSLAIGELKLTDWWRILRREITSGLVLGSMLGLTGLIVGTLIAYYLPTAGIDTASEALRVGFAIGTALVGVVMMGIVMGSMLPLVLESAGLDPATCSTPFVSTIVDVAGLIIYFVVAMLVLGV